jgi:hypothetical protein
LVTTHGWFILGSRSSIGLVGYRFTVGSRFWFTLRSFG